MGIKVNNSISWRSFNSKHLLATLSMVTNVSLIMPQETLSMLENVVVLYMPRLGECMKYAQSSGTAKTQPRYQPEYIFCEYASVYRDATQQLE